MKKSSKVGVFLVLAMLLYGCSNMQAKDAENAPEDVIQDAMLEGEEAGAQGNVGALEVGEQSNAAAWEAGAQGNADALVVNTQGNAGTQKTGESQWTYEKLWDDEDDGTQAGAAKGTEAQGIAAQGLAEAPKAEPFEFNPHVHCDLLSEIVSEETWASFYNMCDAIRAGEDTFECTDQKAYEWCTNEVTIGAFLPAACTIVVGGGYKDGVGKLKYKMDKEQFLAREQAFEEEICRILNEATRTDASEFEKLMGIYAYMCRYWEYDYNNVDGMTIEDFGDYACLMHKNGICAEIASALTYLLLQCDVQAMPFGTSCEHDWTYVVIGGEGYHVDATWGLHENRPYSRLNLQYFMMTEQDRIDQGFDKNRFQADLIWYWKQDYDLARFSATDDAFQAIRYGAEYMGMDTERNVIKYRTWDGKTKELSYGEM